ncbi:MAG: 50S ribosomal protein L25 [Verrucomicrobiaceae bacterium]|nr:MAG: 50S ribosomal protein L25 [Verrucomicrobiaceae bacterium]
MAKQVKLSARPRSESGRNAVKAVRARGGVPAVIYGSKSEPANLEVSRREIEALLSHAVGENILVDLEIEEGGKKTNRLSLIQEVQHHPLRGDVLHVDFHAVSMTEEISADVVIESTGEPDGVKNFGGLLEQSMRSVSIKCLPQNLPEIIRVDVSPLKIGDSIHVRDLPLPAGVTATDDADLTVFIVAEPTVVEEPVAAAAPESPEVIKEKKPEAGASEEKK